MSEHRRRRSQLDPENTLYMDLKNGRVVIQLFPDIAPKHVERVKILTPRGLLRRHAVPSRDRGLHGAGRRPDRHRHRRQRAARPAGRVHQQAALPARHRAAWRAPRIRTARNSQFFIMFAPAPHLDGQYTIWGQVMSGHGIRRPDQARQRRQRDGEQARTRSFTCGSRPT